MSQTPEFAPAYVSVVNEFPEDLYDAMRTFVRTHPHWDQYRLMQVAVAGFLFQQGSRERAVARHYLDGLFDRGAGHPQGAGEEAASPGAAVAATPAPRREAQAASRSPRRLESSAPTPVSFTSLRPRPNASPGAALPLRPVVPPAGQHPPATSITRRAA